MKPVPPRTATSISGPCRVPQRLQQKKSANFIENLFRKLLRLTISLGLHNNFFYSIGLLNDGFLCLHGLAFVFRRRKDSSSCSTRWGPLPALFVLSQPVNRFVGERGSSCDRRALFQPKSCSMTNECWELSIANLLATRTLLAPKNPPGLPSSPRVANHQRFLRFWSCASSCARKC